MKKIWKNECFWTILTMLTFSWIINEICVNILIFLYSWTDNTPMILKMYNIIGIWWTDQKLLTVKPIATLRDMKWNKKRRGAQDIWLPDWLTDWLTDRLTDWLTDWLNSCWRYCPFLTNWLTSCWRYCPFLTDWMTDWLTDELLKILSLSWIIKVVSMNIWNYKVQICDLRTWFHVCTNFQIKRPSRWGYFYFLPSWIINKLRPLNYARITS